VNANAETLRDPTQLPTDVVSLDNNLGFNSNTTSSSLVLQSVILSDKMRAAIINGQRINLGDAYQEAKLVALTENSATLVRADGNKTVLKMAHIGIKKTEKTVKKNLANTPLMATKASRVR